jgi:hypothetical protein
MKDTFWNIRYEKTQMPTTTLVVMEVCMVGWDLGTLIILT